MGICIDSSTKFLKKLGYNVVRLPRAGIAPLQLIGVQNGEALQLGSLDKLVRGSTQSLPAIVPNERASGVNGQRSSELAAAIGLSVLAGIVGSMGGKIGVSAQYKSARKITFEYADVTGDAVAPLDVGQYLRHAEVDIDNKIIEQYVLGNGRLYLITRTLKSTKFTVTASASGGKSLGVDVPAIQDVVGANVKVSLDTSSTDTVTYEGREPLVFGFQCLDVGVRDGLLSLENTAAGTVAMSDVPAEPEAVILDRDGLLEIA